MTPRNFSPPPPRIAAWRRYLFCAAVMLMFALPLAGGPMRAAVFAEEAAQESENIHRYRRDIAAHRGDISDAAGMPLAASVDVYEVRADMSVLNGDKDRAGRLKEAAPEIAKILEIDSDEMMRRINRGGRAVLLKRVLSPAAAIRLSELREIHGLRGLRIDYRSKRYYPQKEYAASVVGRIDHESRGVAGVELARHGELQPVAGRAAGVRARTGRRIGIAASRPAQDGADVTLALDSRLQFFAYRALQDAVLRHAASAGGVAVMDLRSGEIVALASYPEINPNNVRGGEHVKNRALSDQVEPGSLAKPFIVALALESGLAREDEIFSAGPLRVGGVMLHDEHIDGPVDLAGVLQKSSNIGAASLAGRIGRGAVWDLYRRLGFGGGKVLDMPGEAPGRLRPHEGWRDSELATHGYGYGFSVSLLQMLAAYSVFADGMRISPRLEKGTGSPEAERVLRPSTARRIRAMLEGAVQEDGTGAAAAVPGYRVAGKTGTARKYDLEAGGYGSEHRAFFVGLAPASRPRYAAAVMIDEPTRNGYGGGAVAAPAFSEIMRRALRLNAIAPDAPEALESGAVFYGGPGGEDKRSDPPAHEEPAPVPRVRNPRNFASAGGGAGAPAREDV